VFDIVSLTADNNWDWLFWLLSQLYILPIGLVLSYVHRELTLYLRVFVFASSTTPGLNNKLYSWVASLNSNVFYWLLSPSTSLWLICWDDISVTFIALGLNVLMFDGFFLFIILTYIELKVNARLFCRKLSISLYFI